MYVQQCIGLRVFCLRNIYVVALVPATLQSTTTTSPLGPLKPWRPSPTPRGADPRRPGSQESKPCLVYLQQKLKPYNRTAVLEPLSWRGVRGRRAGGIQTRRRMSNLWLPAAQRRLYAGAIQVFRDLLRDPLEVFVLPILQPLKTSLWTRPPPFKI